MQSKSAYAPGRSAVLLEGRTAATQWPPAAQAVLPFVLVQAILAIVQSSAALRGIHVGMAENDAHNTTEPANPLPLFHDWMRDAEAHEPNDPNAAALATADAFGMPSVRMVLVKRVDADGFRFFTNAGSQKGMELAANPRAALCFHWKSLRRQVRVAGQVLPVVDDEVDQYFHSRSRRSQIGAAVSQQSRPLANREEMEKAVKRFGEKHPDEIPRPEYWRGYAVQPERIEFWNDGPDRLHDRVLWLREADGWSSTRLWP